MVQRLKVCVAGWMVLLFTAWAHAQTAADFSALPRMALVVSNGQFGDKALTSAANDAQAMANALTAAGFAVQRKANLNSVQFEDTVTQFSRQVAQARAFSVVYLAGMGTTVRDSIRYFASTNISVATEDEAFRHSSALTWVLAEMALWRRTAGSTAPVVLIADIDTRRWGTFEDVQLPNLELVYGSLQRESQTMVMLPNELGKSAYETQDGKHGLFTKHLAEAFTTKGADILQIFGKAALAVRRHAPRPAEPELIYKGLEIRKTVFIPTELTDDPKARGRSARVM